MAECQLASVSGALPAATAACIVHARATAEHGSVQMGPFNGVFLARVVTGMLAWEGAFQGVRLVSARHVRQAASGGAAGRDERDFWLFLVPSYAVSTLHALLMCWCVCVRTRKAQRGRDVTRHAHFRRGTLHVTSLWRAPEAEQMVIVPGGAYYAASEAVELSNWRVSRPRRSAVRDGPAPAALPR